MAPFDETNSWSFQARQSYIRRDDLRKEHDGTFTSVLGLQFDLAPHHLKNGKLTLQCTATILSVYWRSTEVHRFISYSYCIFEKVAAVVAQ